jgi:hypothetical protein
LPEYDRAPLLYLRLPLAGSSVQVTAGLGVIHVSVAPVGIGKGEAVSCAVGEAGAVEGRSVAPSATALGVEIPHPPANTTIARRATPRFAARRLAIALSLLP